MKNKYIRSLGAWFVMIIAVMIILFPLSILVYGSFQGGGWHNYAEIITKYHIHTYFINSLIISGLSVAVIVTLDIMAGFAFSKMQFPGKNFFYIFSLSALLLPAAAIMVPVFQISAKLHLLNTYLALLGPYVVMIAPFNLLTIKNGFDTLPDTIIEASILDGCSMWRTLWSVAAPMCKPPIIMAFIWTFLSSWNEYLFAFIMLRREAIMTITVIPTKFESMYGGRMGMLYSSLLLILLPSIIVYFIMQKFIVGGMNAGAIKE